MYNKLFNLFVVISGLMFIGLLCGNDLCLNFVKYVVSIIDNMRFNL
jgi:hypothetical protein